MQTQDASEFGQQQYKQQLPPGAVQQVTSSNIVDPQDPDQPPKIPPIQNSVHIPAEPAPVDLLPESRDVYQVRRLVPV